jgi:predicted metal-dependent phosphoesterase TrpH
MDGIIERMNQVTDHSEVRKLQAQAKVEKTHKHLEHVLDRANAAGLTVHLPLTFDTPKDVRIRNVVAATLRKLDPKDHAEAKRRLASAAATGYVAKDMMGSDAHVHTATIVDHSVAGPFTPSIVTSSTTTQLRTPE